MGTNRKGSVSDAGEGAVVSEVSNAEDVDTPSVHTVQYMRQLLLIRALHSVTRELLSGEAVGVCQSSLHTGYLQVNNTQLVRHETPDYKRYKTCSYAKTIQITKY